MASFLLLFPLLLLLSSPSVQAQQNIALGFSLAPQGPDKLWLSPSGDFAFGFRPVDGNSSFYLLAVWFNQISDQTVAWYAKSTDPEPAPVQVSSGARLQITSAGALSLQDPTGTEVWNPKVVGASYASMLDSGNFVLVHANGSTKWETFNNPADTILLNQVLTPGMTLRSRIIATDYSNGRFLLNLQSDGVGLYPVAVPSGNQYDSYWSKTGNTTKLVFDATGRIYIAMDNGTQLNMTSGVPGSMEQYYHRATLDTDGVFRQYRHLKISAQWSQASWTVVDFQPPNICEAMTNVGSGACGFNSYCTFNDTYNQNSCECPPPYSFLDVERKYKGCKPDFQPQSCDLDEASAMIQFELIDANYVDWPLADYEAYNPITENQ